MFIGCIECIVVLIYSINRIFNCMMFNNFKFCCVFRIYVFFFSMKEFCKINDGIIYFVNFIFLDFLYIFFFIIFGFKIIKYLLFFNDFISL